MAADVDADGVSNETNIGANAATYTPVAADVGKQIKVQVSFTDDRGHAEGPLTSDAYPRNGTVTVVVLRRAGPLSRGQRLVRDDTNTANDGGRRRRRRPFVRV